MTKKYFKNEFFNISDYLTTKFSELDFSNLDESDIALFEKMNSILFLGQLIGLPTLKSILTKLEITSNSLQINYTKLYKKLTINKLRLIFEFVFEYQVICLLKEMILKDSTIWSKQPVTIVLDDSVFHQWLSDLSRESDYFGRFFSGQYHCGVSGFKVVCLGIYIDEVFYPLYFDFVRNKDTVDKQENIQVAKKLIGRWGRLRSKLEREGYTPPTFHFSCDNGYNNVSLSEECSKKENDLIYISVPNKGHIFTINNKTIKLNKFIEIEFLKKEKQHQESEKHLEKEAKTPFTLRIKGFYKCQNRNVTLLFFRLNNSKKVSIIYTPNQTIFAKTLRRNWFNRTYIEQFFKTLKHVLKISEARTKDKEEFENKILRFAFLAIEVQKIIKFIRKKCKQFKQKGFIALQRILYSEQEIIDLLQNKMKVND